MKHDWQPSDIKPSRIVGKPGAPERWLIGLEAEPDHSLRRYVLVSLDDGMVSPPATAETMAVVLNAGGYVPAEMLAGGRK